MTEIQLSFARIVNYEPGSGRNASVMAGGGRAGSPLHAAARG